MPEACNFIKKEALTQAFSSEFCEIFKNTFFIEHLRWLMLSFVSEKACIWEIYLFLHGLSPPVIL